MPGTASGSLVLAGGPPLSRHGCYALRALSRGTRLDVQRAAVGRGGPGGADAGRAFVTVSASSASVRCPKRASSVRACLVHANCCPVSGVASERPGVRRPLSRVRRPVSVRSRVRCVRPGGNGGVAVGVGSRTAAMAGLVVARVVGQWAGRLGGLPGSARCTPEDRPSLGAGRRSEEAITLRVHHVGA